MTLTYGLRNARDLLEKLKRDAALLHDEVTSDRFFNFVVTGYSIADWLKHEPSVPRSDVDPMYKNQWIKICGDLANASKHFELDPKKRIPIVSKAMSDRGFGRGRFGRGGFGVGEEEICVELTGGVSYTCFAIVSNVVAEWESFFKAHNL